MALGLIERSCLNVWGGGMIKKESNITFIFVFHMQAQACAQENMHRHVCMCVCMHTHSHPLYKHTHTHTTYMHTPQICTHAHKERWTSQSIWRSNEFSKVRGLMKSAYEFQRVYMVSPSHRSSSEAVYRVSTKWKWPPAEKPWFNILTLKKIEEGEECVLGCLNGLESLETAACFTYAASVIIPSLASYQLLENYPDHESIYQG